MQLVSSAFTAEEKDSVRKIAHNLQVSWKKHTTIGNITFTIGVSTIGGDDVIGINPGAIGNPGIYKYSDESEYAMGYDWERGLNYPLGGLSMGMAGIDLDNTSGRFTPRYMGGDSELYTAILPRRPIIINAGFNFDGIDQSIPAFSGVLNKQPKVDARSKLVQLQATDYIGFFQNRYLDQEVMFTSQRTDQVLETLFDSLGMSTAQYRVDEGLHTIPFGLFEKGKKFSDIMHQLAEAENGYIYQDELGITRFENRQHWYGAPYNSVAKEIATAQVLNAEVPNEDSIINVVEIEAPILQKQPNQLLFQLGAPLAIPPGNTELFVNFDDPVLELQEITGYKAFVNQDGTGTDLTANVSIGSVDKFSKAAKIIIINSGVTGFLTQLYLYGRPVKKSSDLYLRAQDDSSVTVYEERPIKISNPYIQNQSWANSLSTLLLQQFSDPESLQRITVRAMPELQPGDLVSWQGIDWRIYNIKTKLNPNEGFIQDILLLRRPVQTYFTIGISTIGGTDQIAP